MVVLRSRLALSVLASPCWTAGRIFRSGRHRTSVECLRMTPRTPNPSSTVQHGLAVGRSARRTFFRVQSLPATIPSSRPAEVSKTFSAR